MGVTGRVLNGVVVMPLGTVFPEGAEVKVEPLVLTAADDSLVAAAQNVVNHGHYVSGEPTQS